MKAADLGCEIELALEALAAIRHRLAAVIEHDEVARPADGHVLGHGHLHGFGHWLHGVRLDAATRAGTPYRVTRRLLAEFQELAERIAGLAAQGRRAEAMALMEGEFAARSHILGRALKSWRAELVG